MASLPVAAIGPFTGMAYNPWNESPPHSSVAYDYDSADETSGLSYFQDQPLMVGDFSCAFLGYDQSPYLSRSSTSSVTMHSSPTLLPFSQDQAACADLSDNFVGAMTVCARDAVEQELGLFDVSLDEEGLASEQRYMEAFFTWIHDQLPIVHKPSFALSPREDLPLLRTAIMALGAQALGRRLDVLNAQTLHETCLKVLKMVC